MTIQMSLMPKILLGCVIWLDKSARRKEIQKVILAIVKNGTTWSRQLYQESLVCKSSLLINLVRWGISQISISHIWLVSHICTKLIEGSLEAYWYHLIYTIQVITSTTNYGGLGPKFHIWAIWPENMFSIILPIIVLQSSLWARCC